MASRLGTAFSHPLNVFLLASSGASAALTGSVWPLVVGGIAELAWLAVGPYLGGQRRYQRALEARATASAALRAEQALADQLAEPDRLRFLEVDRIRGDIRRLAADNPSVSMEMMRAELKKVDELVDAFLRIAAETARVEAFTQETDLNALETDVRRQRTALEKSEDAEARAGATSRLTLLEERLEGAAAVRRRVRTARGRLVEIEQALALLRDRVVTMQTPEEIAPALDELMQSVASIEATAREVEALADPRRGQIAQAARDSG